MTSQSHAKDPVLTVARHTSTYRTPNDEITLHGTISGTTSIAECLLPTPTHGSGTRIYPTTDNPNVTTQLYLGFLFISIPLKYKTLMLYHYSRAMIPPKWEIRYRYTPSGYTHLMWVNNNRQWTPYYLCLVSTSLAHLSLLLCNRRSRNQFTKRGVTNLAIKFFPVNRAPKHCKNYGWYVLPTGKRCASVCSSLYLWIEYNFVNSPVRILIMEMTISWRSWGTNPGTQIDVLIQYTG